VGVIVSALVFAWKHAQHILVDTSVDADGQKIYDLRGPIFFGSVSNFKELFDVDGDPDDVVIEFKRSRISDHSGIEAIQGLAEKYAAQGKRLHLRHLSSDCVQLLQRSDSLVDVEVDETSDPQYRVATDLLA
jgi:SulP family sulfate permease